MVSRRPTAVSSGCRAEATGRTLVEIMVATFPLPFLLLTL
jgi:hypothetical protein